MRKLLVPALLSSSVATSHALEFLLPLPGETIQSTDAAILVRADSSDGTPRAFRLVSPDTVLRCEATPRGDGLFSASIQRLRPGAWNVVVEGPDSAGVPTALGTISFRTAELEPTLLSANMATHPEPATQEKASAGRVPASAHQPRTQQSLYLAVDAGYRQGLSEGPVEAWRTLKLVDGHLEAGDREAVLDREASASATAVWDLRRGPLQLRTKTVADLGDRPGRTQALHRLSIDGSYGPWVDAHVGDQYPAWSPLLMDGSRIRGLGLGLTATRDGDAWGRVRYVAGWSRRATDPAVELLADGTTDTAGASYDRRIQALHVGLGGGKRVLWGLTFVHAIDDTSSVDMALQDSLRMQAPRENAAVGSDLQIWFWKRRIELFGHWSTSLVTENTRLGSATDSVGSDINLESFDVLSPAITLNSSTRGLVKLLSDDPGSRDAFSFLGDNSALRTGIRLNTPVSAGRMSHELRWVHAGASWESFARGTTLPAQTGAEFSHASSWAHDRVFLTATTGFYAVPRDALDDADRTRVSAAASIAQGEVMPGAYLDGGKDWTNEPQGGRADSWNAGGGIYRSFRPAEDHALSANAGYSRAQTDSRIDSASTTAARLVQDSWSGTLRWRLPAPFELRTGGQFTSSRTTVEVLDERSASTLETVRGSLGASVWLFGRDLELAVDGGVDRCAGEAVEDGIRQWNQNSRILWRLPADQSLRISQQLVQIVDGRGDLRIDAGWEKFF